MGTVGAIGFLVFVGLTAWLFYKIGFRQGVRSTEPDVPKEEK